jgi:hypothetical protein
VQGGERARAEERVVELRRGRPDVTARASPPPHGDSRST